ncbi:capsular polysaccharide export protein [Gemmobacter megaterium]|uniref:Capsular polysaccharide export protein n=1 Tax=Gemmobacter megaterium TaxID=1086013 RepID=A0A1N7K6G0_9RHOB|nr:capsular biosynthesis protein [Gemmobacter megaterium]GGE00585.1 capsule biosynthesis protein CapA [Gemmobacter megaterium]SIS57138.1 capsular polysaccharide export protein [Gemmobacter megaterium]
MHQSTTTPGAGRRFLMLQGPHGPFFASLAAMLRASGAQVLRVGFNMGDRVFWPDAASYIPWTAPPEEWPAGCASLLDRHAITDLVLYGDTRPIHAHAVALAKARGITVHVFEEGYLRPYWVTYERGGSNGHSRLMQMSLPDMRAALEHADEDVPDAPAVWGDLRQHVFYGALYHFFVMVANRGYRNFRPHRSLSVVSEFRLYFRRLILMPVNRMARWLATRRIHRGGFPYHLVLLQLEHDSSFRMHSSFASMTEFIALVIDGFARGAPSHHHLVFKAHPLEDGRAAIERTIADEARKQGVQARVHYVSGGKLAGLLNHARTAVTVNSTAAQQALWRGLPIKAFGQAVYNLPEFISSQPLPEFFANPRRPDARAYRDYRRFLLETSQIVGGFYSARGRRALLRQVVDTMLAPEDPYDALRHGCAAPRQQLRVVT